MRRAEEVFRRGRCLLKNLSQPEIEARALLCKSASILLEDFLTNPEISLSQAQESLFFRLIKKRLSGFPLAYLTGSQDFWSESFRVSPGVLIPRPETELIVERVVELSTSKEGVIVDIGTGCGNVALSIAKEFPHAKIVATDISKKALKAAWLNASRQDVSNVSFIQGDVFAPIKKLGLEEQCDFIVSNPPYVARKDWESLDREVRDHEPRQALVPGETGLEMIVKLVGGAHKFLKPKGYLVMEIGYGQKKSVREMFDDNWDLIDFSADLAEIPRVVTGRKR